MATRTALNLPTGAIVNEAWTDGVAQSSITVETATPAVLMGEGAVHVRSDQDRLLCQDGAGAQVRIGHYSTAGRTGGTWTTPYTSSTVNNNQTFSSNLEQLYWGGELADSDAFYDHAAVTRAASVVVPAGLGGIYCASAALTFPSGWSPTADLLRLNVGGVVYDFAGAAAYGQFAGSVVAPIAAGQGVSVSVRQDSGINGLTVTGRLELWRLCA